MINTDTAAILTTDFTVRTTATTTVTVSKSNINSIDASEASTTVNIDLISNTGASTIITITTDNSFVNISNELTTTTTSPTKESMTTRTSPTKEAMKTITSFTTEAMKTRTSATTEATTSKITATKAAATTLPSIIPNIPSDARWAQKGKTVAGSHGNGANTNQLFWPQGLSIDDDQTMVIADYGNHRIIQWKMGEENGQILVGGNNTGNRLDQLNGPTALLIDKKTDSLIICDKENRRVIQWYRPRSIAQRKILFDNINCWGLAMDDQRFLYISDTDKNEVRRYQIGHQNGTVVAGGNGKGSDLNQLNWPMYIFVDQQQTVYVSDRDNHRVMKWDQGTKKGIVVAGGQGQGNSLTQFSHPTCLFVDTLGTLYVADSLNQRVMRWPKGAKQGTVIVGGNGQGAGEYQLNWPTGLAFDRHGNLYVIDGGNHRVQYFSIE
ncbi:unnamed protein product [Rotaria sp. Silwood1]|nr:unnamed protein product [Rotaria sp. Silwood1]